MSLAVGYRLLDPGDAHEIVQLGVAPSRIDLLRSPEGPAFEDAWEGRIDADYGEAPARWIGLESLIDIKGRIEHPRHQDDARVLRMVRERRISGAADEE